MRYFQNGTPVLESHMIYLHVTQLNYGDLNSKIVVTSRHFATNGPDEGKSRIYHLNTTCEWYLYSKHFHFILATIKTIQFKMARF